MLFPFGTDRASWATLVAIGILIAVYADYLMRGGYLALVPSSMHGDVFVQLAEPNTPLEADQPYCRNDPEGAKCQLADAYSLVSSTRNHVFIATKREEGYEERMCAVNSGSCAGDVWKRIERKVTLAIMPEHFRLRIEHSVMFPDQSRAVSHADARGALVGANGEHTLELEKGAGPDELPITAVLDAAGIKLDSYASPELDMACRAQDNNEETGESNSDALDCSVRNTWRQTGIVIHMHIQYTLAWMFSEPTYKYIVVPVPRAEGHRSGTRAFAETDHLFAKRIRWHEHGIKIVLHVSATPGVSLGGAMTHLAVLAVLIGLAQMCVGKAKERSTERSSAGNQPVRRAPSRGPSST